MIFATANDAPLVTLKLCIPREGVWHGELAATADGPLDFALELRLAGVPFKGTARKSGFDGGTAVAEFVGGAGALGRDVTPKAYRKVPVSVPLRDILGEVGEELSPSSMRDVTELELPFWSTMASKAGHAVNSLMKLGAGTVAGAVWRIRPDGKLWVGVESWPDVDPATQTLSSDLLADRAVLSMEEPSIMPGVKLFGRRVNYVEHILQDSVLRTSVWFE